MGLCERFSCLPSQLYKEDAELIRMVRMVERARPDENGPDEYGEEADHFGE